MKRTTLYILSLLGGLACLPSCSSQDDAMETNSPVLQGNGSVVIKYSVEGNSAITRVEDGNSSLNENKVKRLDLFVVRGSSITKHAEFDFTDSPVTDASTQQELDCSGKLYYSDIQVGDILYLVANDENLAGTNISTLTALYAEKTPAFTQGKQDAFVMDARHEVGSNDFIDEGETNVLTVHFDLKRAIAKIRFTFNGTNLPEQYQFVQYSNGTTIIDNDDNQDLSAIDGNSAYENTPLCSMPDYAEVTTDSPLTDENGCYIFYSYPNDWFDQDLYEWTKSYDDKDKLEWEGYTASGSGMHNAEPIVAERQTYLLVKARYGEVLGYYKIPVNYRLPEDGNDETSDQVSYTEAQLKNIRDNYYRIKRNTIYDVSVTISGPGGTLTEPVIPEITVTKINDWVSGGDYQLPPGGFQ